MNYTGSLFLLFHSYCPAPTTCSVSRGPGSHVLHHVCILSVLHSLGSASLHFLHNFHCVLGIFWRCSHTVAILCLHRLGWEVFIRSSRPFPGYVVLTVFDFPAISHVESRSGEFHRFHSAVRPSRRSFSHVLRTWNFRFTTSLSFLCSASHRSGRFHWRRFCTCVLRRSFYVSRDPIPRFVLWKSLIPFVFLFLWLLVLRSFDGDLLRILISVFRSVLPA